MTSDIGLKRGCAPCSVATPLSRIFAPLSRRDNHGGNHEGACEASRLTLSLMRGTDRQFRPDRLYVGDFPFEPGAVTPDGMQDDGALRASAIDSALATDALGNRRPSP